MTKFAAVLAVAALLIPSASGLQPGPARIRLTATLIHEANEYDTYALFNRPAYPDRLGTAFIYCTTADQGYSDCREILRLSRGQIVARGVVPTASSFRTLAVLGGTGYYSNVGGEMIVQPINHDVQLILVILEAFS